MWIVKGPMVSHRRGPANSCLWRQLAAPFIQAFEYSPDWPASWAVWPICTLRTDSHSIPIVPDRSIPATTVRREEKPQPSAAGWVFDREWQKGSVLYIELLLTLPSPTRRLWPGRPRRG